jgi:hypothetical protein
VERKPELDDDGVDVSLVRWMLSLTPDERLDVLQGFADSVAELRDVADDSEIP